jgi:dephospho-CoA kinase
MVVGLTGGIGSGKTTVLEYFKKVGNIAVYNADVEAKKLMSTSLVIKEKIINHFGEDSYINNKLNRSYIANKVFSNKLELAVLNSIVHPEVYKHLKLFIETNQSKDYVIYENAILFENKSDAFCDFIISVYASKRVRIERVVKRDNVSEDEVQRRIDNQWSDQKKLLLSNYVIDNNGNFSIDNQIVRIHNILTKKKASI